MLEWWLHRLRKERKLIITEYGSKTLERLRSVLPQVEVVFHDLRWDEPLAADVHLLHRVDTELSNAEWGRVFERFASEHVLVVADVLTLRGVFAELRTRRRAGATSAGFVRSRSAIEALWRRTHVSERRRVYDLHAWALTPRGTVGLDGEHPS